MLRFVSKRMFSANPNPKILDLTNQISNLTLVETNLLVQSLKEKLNIQEITPIAAPVAAVNAAPVEQIEEKPKEKTEFTLKLIQFDAASKAKVIREIKSILPGSNLVEAKKFVESAPKIIKENVQKEEAEKIKKALEAVGAKVEMN